MKKKTKYLIILLAISLIPILNVQAFEKVSCGNIGSFAKKIPEITSYVVTIIQIAVPVVLVIMGTLDFVKSITAQKEDEMKKNQQLFVKRLITAAIVFFAIVIVKLLVSLIDSKNSGNISECMDCFLNNECKSSGAGGSGNTSVPK